MCFSAPVSFVSGAALSVIGVATIKKAKKKNILLASIPLLFSVQQIFEGIQWITLKSGSFNGFAAYGFLFFAFAVWPFYIPLSIYSIEANIRRKKELKIYLFLGAIFFAAALQVLLTNDLQVYVQSLHIVYDISTPYNRLLLTLIYIGLVAGVPFRSTNKSIRYFGLAVLIASVIAQLFFTLSFVSVWCFFAALISVGIYWIIPKLNKATVYERRRTRRA